MAGLLDSIFGAPGSDQSQAMGLLAAGLVKGDFGGGLLAANQVFSPEAKMKRDYMQAQMQNLQSEVETRKQKLKDDQDFSTWLAKRMSGGQPQAAASAGPVNMGAGMPVDGSQLLPQPQSTAPAQTQSWLMGMSPEEQFYMKLRGKDPVDIINANKPKWENVGGNMVNTNDPNFRGGFVDQIKFDEKGGATRLSRGADGQPQASIVPGSLEAYSQFRRADAGINSENELVKVYDPVQQREVLVRKSAVLGGQPQQPQPQAQPRPMLPSPMQPQAMPTAQAGMSGNFVGDPAQAMGAILNIKDPQERANAMAAFTEQAKRTQGFAQGAGFAAGPSSGEKATAAGQQEYETKRAADVVEQRKGIMNAGFVAPQNIARYQQIGKLLQDVDGGSLTPTGTHIASLANSLGLKIDKGLPNKEAAASLANQAALELRNPAGGAGMPGALSDSDRNFLVSMTPNMAQSAQGRKQIIDSYVAIQQRNAQIAQFARKYENKYGRLDNGFFDQMQAWSNANPLFGGK
jgi:hypothetical protein